MIEVKTGNEAEGEFVFKLAEIKSVKGEGQTAYLEIDQIWTGNIDGGGGVTSSHPFKLTTSMVSDTAHYTIGKGTIIDGTNGAALDLDGVIETAFPATTEGYVVIEATVTPATLAIGSWASRIADAEEASKEVVLTGDPPQQTQIRFCIGKITLSGDPEEVAPEDPPLTATAWQGWMSSVRVVHGILNGVEVLVLEAAPTHPSVI
jgi:hypothetical protein